MLRDCRVCANEKAEGRGGLKVLGWDRWGARKGGCCCINEGTGAATAAAAAATGAPTGVVEACASGQEDAK